MPQAELFSIENVRDDVVIVTVAAEVEFAHEVVLERVGQELIATLRKGEKFRLIINLANVNYFGNTFVSLLLRLHSLTEKSGGAMVLLKLSEPAGEVLRVLNMETLWEICETRESAIKAVT